MASFNKVMLMGNLTRDPELSYTPSQTPVCKFGIAMNRKFGKGDQQKEEVTYVNIECWGAQAESVNKYMHKGSSIFIEGRLKFSSWQAQDGSRKQKLEVTAEKVTFLGAPNQANTPKNNAVPEEEIPF